MKSSWPTALAFVWEPDNDGGGDHTDPGDSGGETNRGVTHATWADMQARGVVPADVALRNATLEQLGTVLKVGFWDACRCDELPAGVDLAVFNPAMVAGPGRGIELLQAAVGVTVDGGFGPVTMAAVLRSDPEGLIRTLTLREENFYKLCPTAPTNLHGWDRRADECRDAALKLAGATPAKETTP